MNIVLYGEEKLLLAQRLEDLKKKYQCTSDDMNYMVYHAGETPMKEIIEDALTQPFLTEYKMVVLKNPIFLTKEKPKKKGEKNTKNNKKDRKGRKIKENIAKNFSKIVNHS